MNWILGLIGAVFGAAMAGERGVFGAAVGFLLVYLLVALGGMRNRLLRSESDLNVLRLRVTELSARATVSAAAAGAQTEAADTADFPQPKPPTGDLLQAVAFRELQSEHEAALAKQKRTSTDPAAEEFIQASPAIDAMVQPVASTTTESAQPRRASPTPRQPPAPGWDDKITAAIKRWFTEGNVPVKIGVLVLFAGVAAALRYAAAQGYFRMPIEVRLAVIAAGALLALGLGWRERIRKPAFGLSLQGGALGVLLLTVFAAYKLYALLPSTFAFALVVVLVAGAAALAVLQEAMALAVLGFLGGYLAPVLISTGSHNHVALFSWYALLNAAVFWVSWRRSWRLLNLIGFAFTFGVGIAWGAKFYRPELFATVEPFLILFFAFYLLIGLLYVLRQSEHRRPWVDGTLVFGTPLLAFPLQAALLKDDRMALAFSALVVGLIYAGLVYWLRRKRDERLLTEAYGALALGFATLAVPLAFSAGTTASVWALEGAGVAWLGIRQNRTFPWLAGLALQLFAAGAYLLSLLHFSPHVTSSLLLLNPDWLGAAILALAGFALSLIHARQRPRYALPVLLFLWATFWLLFAGATQWDLASASIGSWRFGMLYLAAIAALTGWLRTSLAWPRLGWLLALVAGLGLPMVFIAVDNFGAPLALPTLGAWAVYAAALLWALWRTRGSEARSPALAHLFWLWTLVLAVSMQLRHIAIVQQLAEGWGFLAQVAPLCLLTFVLWRMPQWMAWPRADDFVRYRNGWFGLALPLLAVFWVIGLLLAGKAAPLAYLPLLNPLELGLLAIAALVFGYVRDEAPSWRPQLRIWPLIAFAFVSMATLRVVHHWHGEPWSMRVFDSGFTQTCLTVVWSLIGVGAWVFGSRRLDRRLWLGGAVLMGIVLLKLVAVDRQYMGNIPGIVSFMAVGLLLVGVGYFAPSPPKREEIEST